MSPLIQLLILAISLALDAVSVSVTSGIEITEAKFKHALRVAVAFGGFQALMPVVGWFIGNSIRTIVAVVAPWIAAVLLIGIGILMLKEAKEEKKEEKRSILSHKTLLLLGVATSIDALLVGITLGLVKIPLILSASVIGVVTFLLCLPAFLFASHLNKRFEGKLDLLGGIALILLGIKTLIGIFCVTMAGKLQLTSDQISSPEEKKNLVIFSLVSFLHDVGSDMVFSVWPIFVTQTLGANVAILGLIDGVGDAVVSLSQAVSGYLSDRLQKRKIFVYLGYLFGGISRLGYALSPTWQWIVPFRVLDRSGKIRSTPRDAMIAESTPASRRGRNFGILRFADNSGAVVGILLAMLLLPVLGFRNLFLLAAIPSLISVVLIFLFIRETKSERKVFKGVSFRGIKQDLLLYTIVSAFFSLATFSYSFLLLFAQSNGFQLGFVPVFYLLFSVVAALFSLPFGNLSDKIGRKKVLIIAYILWLLVPTIFLITHEKFFVFLGFFIYGLHKAALDPVQTSFITELAPKEYLASTLGGFQLVVGVCNLPSSAIAGLLWQIYGPSSAFITSIVLTFLAIGVLLFIKERRGYK